MEGERESVVRANSGFYEALNSLDVEGMERVWSHGPEVRCIHPGWDVIVGWPSVRQSWESIFAAGTGLSVVPFDVEVNVYGDLAWVHCLERITNALDEEEAVAHARTTNLFLRTSEGWRMILHHASPIPSAEPSPPADAAVH